MWNPSRAGRKTGPCSFGVEIPHADVARRVVPGALAGGCWPAWASFLSCYHFGRHLEHHAFPGVPWWRLQLHYAHLEMDLTRVGVYGWSFGGYFSAMAARISSAPTSPSCRRYW